MTAQRSNRNYDYGTLNDGSDLFNQLLTRCEALAAACARSILGITGPPGAGKSTLAQAIVRSLGSRGCYIPMDGFHLANEELVRLGCRDRKGAPETFDAAGYASLLRRLHDPTEKTIYAPRFNRDTEESIAGAIPIVPSVRLIVTEGNYLLLPISPWNSLRQLFDEVWYLNPDETLRRQALIQRHVGFGKTPEAARAWALGSDERNATLVAETQDYADLVLAGPFVQLLSTRTSKELLIK